MADGRLRQQWNQAASVMLNARLCVSNEKRISVYDLVPEKYRPEREEVKKTEEQIERESQIAWAAMEHFYTGGHGKAWWGTEEKKGE